jgi:hypothetical protein
MQVLRYDMGNGLVPGNSGFMRLASHYFFKNNPEKRLQKVKAFPIIQ